jgi:hypothetical protein
MHTPNPSVITVLEFERQERLDRAERNRLVRTRRHAASDGAPRTTGMPHVGFVRSALTVLAILRPGMRTT